MTGNTTTKNIIAQTDPHITKDVGRKVQLSVDMTPEDMERALELQRIAVAWRRNGGTVRPALKYDRPSNQSGGNKAERVKKEEQ